MCRSDIEAYMNILVLDDDKLVIKLVKGLLEPEGHVISSVNTIAGAIKVIKSNPPELFLLDLNLELETAYDFLKIRSSDEILKSVPVYIISASAQEMDIITTAVRGAENYILKPLNKKVLLKKISQLEA